MLLLHSITKILQKGYQNVMKKMNQACMDQRGASGRLDQKPTSVISTATDLKDPLRQFLSSY